MVLILFITLVAQPDSAARSRGTLDFGRERRNKINAMLNFGMNMSIP